MPLLNVAEWVHNAGGWAQQGYQLLRPLGQTGVVEVWFRYHDLRTKTKRSNPTGLVQSYIAVLFRRRFITSTYSLQHKVFSTTALDYMCIAAC